MFEHFHNIIARIKSFPPIDPTVNELALPEDDDANNFTDGDNFLANQAANSHLLHQSEIQVVRASQPLR